MPVMRQKTVIINGHRIIALDIKHRCSHIIPWVGQLDQAFLTTLQGQDCPKCEMDAQDKNTERTIP